MSIFKKKKICITHSGAFHADDLFATAVLSISNNGNIKIIRTRDPKIIPTGDYIYDVGGIYDVEKNKFDHHQKNGAGTRENGIPYAALGLVWKHFGLTICGNDSEVWKVIEDKIVTPIDAIDNGVDIIVPKFKDVIPYGIEQPFLIYSPTWEEENLDIDKIFKEQVSKIIVLLKREISVARSEVKGKKIILEAYKKSINKKIIEIEYSFPRFLYQKVLSSLPEPIYIVYPSGHSEIWKVEAIRKDFSTMDSRKLLPRSWWGFLGNDPKLKEISGVKDVLFCHKNGFLSMAGSREGARKLAEIALSDES